MGITITPTNSDKEYAEIRGSLAENACMLGWQAFKVYKLDEMTIALAGWLQSSIGLDVYPREKQLKLPELVVLKLRSREYEVNGKDSKGDWIKVKREPGLIEKALANEVLASWDMWVDRIWEGNVTLNDSLASPATTPIGQSNHVWNFRPSLHSSVPEWIIPDPKSTNGFSSKFIPKKTALEIYAETKQILEQELNCDHSLGSLLRDLRNKFGEAEASEVINTVIYGILAK